MIALESTFSKGDSVLGEQCGSVAKITKETSPTASGVPCFVKGTNAKFANLPQFSQSYHSLTATPRILEEEKSSLRGSEATAAIHKDKSQKVDSRFFTQTAQSLISRRRQDF
ncbi:hypothetical protein [Helicobacter canis]|uniref:hypothetical protein n=1 Tax=Helicobacter canis TaxID=29419 RepID=UPI001FE4879A|nr:hypothetical protein [Helicobacter canis]